MNKYQVRTLLVIMGVMIGFLFVLVWQVLQQEPPDSTIADYSLQNCSFVSKPEKIMVCFDFNQDGKSLGAYATSSRTIFLRTTNQDTVRHEALHHLLYRDTLLNEDQQHKFINDLETIEKEIFKLRTK